MVPLPGDSEVTFSVFELKLLFILILFCLRQKKTNSNLKAGCIAFSMQVVMSKDFLLNPENKFGADLSCRFREKRKKRIL